MSSINQTSKRRRLEHAASTLSKPFKSPLRRPHDADASQKEENPTPTPKNSIANNYSPVADGPQSRKRKELVVVDDTPSPTPTRFFKSSSSSDPVLADLQKQQRILQSRLAVLRSELDTARQALRIESSAKDDELAGLITKWRSVSQDAVDEVFAGAKERVLRMGGLTAWNERARKGNGWWDNDEEEARDLETRKAELLDQYDYVQERCEKKRSETDIAEVVEEEEEETYTMETMLKTLNIDLKIIGFDQSGQRWIKD